MERRLGKSGTVEFLTSENPDKFDSLASVFTHQKVKSRRCALD